MPFTCRSEDFCKTSSPTRASLHAHGTAGLAIEVWLIRKSSSETPEREPPKHTKRRSALNETERINHTRRECNHQVIFSASTAARWHGPKKIVAAVAARELRRAVNVFLAWAPRVAGGS